MNSNQKRGQNEVTQFKNKGTKQFIQFKQGEPIKEEHGALQQSKIQSVTYIEDGEPFPYKKLKLENGQEVKIEKDQPQYLDDASVLRELAAHELWEFFRSKVLISNYNVSHVYDRQKNYELCIFVKYQAGDQEQLRNAVHAFLDSLDHKSKYMFATRFLSGPIANRQDCYGAVYEGFKFYYQMFCRIYLPCFENMFNAISLFIFPDKYNAYPTLFSLCFLNLQLDENGKQILLEAKEADLNMLDYKCNLKVEFLVNVVTQEVKPSEFARSNMAFQYNVKSEILHYIVSALLYQNMQTFALYQKYNEGPASQMYKKGNLNYPTKYYMPINFEQDAKEMKKYFE